MAVWDNGQTTRRLKSKKGGLMGHQVVIVLGVAAEVV
jgi:hypothetical protein